MNRISSDFRVDSQKSPHQLEREIDATRAELLSTIEELEHRLSPSDLINQLWGQVRHHGGDFGVNLGQTLRDNPVPVLLTTIGIAWMMASNGRHHDSAYVSGSRLDNGNGYGNGNGNGRMHAAGERVRATGERMRERMHGVRQRMHDVRDKMHGARDSMRHRAEGAGESMRHRAEGAREGVLSARERAAGSAQYVRERARSMSSSARYRASRARSGFGHLLEEQPLLLGAIGLAAGVIAGAALPPTEQEDRAFGRARDRALERAKQASAEKARLLRERAEEAAESTKSALESGHDTHSTPTDHLTARAGGSVESSPGTHTSSPGTGLGY